MTHPINPGDEARETLREAAKAVVHSASDTYRKGNGHIGSIEGDDGEKCWIVPFDEFEALRRALATLPPVEEAAGVPRGVVAKKFDRLFHAFLDRYADYEGHVSADDLADYLGDVRHHALRAFDALDAIIVGARRSFEVIEAEEQHTRQGGPAPEDLQDLSDALDRCVGEALDEIHRIDMALEAINA